MKLNPDVFDLWIFHKEEVVVKPQNINLTDSHSEYGWFSHEEYSERIKYRGLLEGLFWTRKYVSECPEPAKEFQLL